VLLRDGTNVNHTLVKDAWFWWYRKYVPGDTMLEGLEKEAREAKNGLWADPQPVPPWSGGRKIFVSEKAYFLALARMALASVALSGTRILLGI